MIREVRAKTLLSHKKHPDPWFGIKYTMNVYRGCQHGCIYCDTRSECYGIDDLNTISVKVNAVERLRDELPRKRVRGIIGTGSMNDPYMPVERIYDLTGQALAVIAEHGYPLHLMTKSDLVLKDLDTLVDIARVGANVSFTVTTADDDLAAKVEPRAPAPSRRFRAMETLAACGVDVGISMMPILPHIEDTLQNVTEIVTRGHDHGARYAIPWFGMTLRDRQREYYYAELDRLWPGLRAKYERRYGQRYECTSPRAERLEAAFTDLVTRWGMATRVRPYLEDAPQQLALL